MIKLNERKLFGHIGTVSPRGSTFLYRTTSGCFKKKTTTNKPTKKHLFKGQTNSHVTGERIASKEAEA